MWPWGSQTINATDTAKKAVATPSTQVNASPSVAIASDTPKSGALANRIWRAGRAEALGTADVKHDAGTVGEPADQQRDGDHDEARQRREIRAERDIDQSRRCTLYQRALARRQPIDESGELVVEAPTDARARDEQSATMPLAPSLHDKAPAATTATLTPSGCRHEHLVAFSCKRRALLRASCPLPFGPACGCSKSLPAILSARRVAHAG
jgi:hypothetical protein